MSLSHIPVEEPNNAPIEEPSLNLTPVDQNHPDEISADDLSQVDKMPGLDSAIAATLWAEAEKSEENALNVTNAVDQLIKLSDRDQYRMALEEVLHDPSLSIRNKVLYKAALDILQSLKDKRAAKLVICLLSKQSNAVAKVLKAYGSYILIGFGGGSALIILFGTDKGRSGLKKAVTWLLKETPKWVHQLAV